MGEGNLSGRSLVNGHDCAHVSIADRGLNYADGLFETLCMRDGRIHLWEQHWQRLVESALRLQLTLSPQAQFLEDIETLTAQEGDHLLKLIITRGESQRGYAIPESADATGNTRILQNLGSPPPRLQAHPEVMICKTRLSLQEQLAGLKHLGRLEQVLARTEVERAGLTEGLMLDTEGRLIEGTQNNLFLFRDGHWFTPALTRCGIDGVYRRFLMAHFSIKQSEMTLDELVHSDSAFFCNSVRGIQVIESIREVRDFDPAPAIKMQDNAEQRLKADSIRSKS